MSAPTPWWKTVRLRDEIVSSSGAIEDIQMSLYNAVHGVAGGAVPYAAAGYYGEITFPSGNLIELMAQIAVRLGSSEGGSRAARALWRLDQGMGGGKSHGLIGMWHLATNPEALATTDVGKAVFAEAAKIAGQGGVASDLNKPTVVVLSCDNMTPGKGDKVLDGPAETLGERFLWRLFDGATKRYNEYREHTSNKAKLADALDLVGRPVLILVDEVLDYLREATNPQREFPFEGDMAFLRALLDTVNDVANCAMVLVMIASDKDAIVLNDNGARCRDELDSLLVRNGRTATVTSANDFAEIIRRRLFENPPPSEVVMSTGQTFLEHMGGSWGKQVFDRLPWANRADFETGVQRSYPFHPSLIDLAESEWSLTAGFQRVRSTIQIFAAAVWAQQQRADRGEWAPLLIGPGDLPLGWREVREALLNSGLIDDARTVSSYREIAATEVVSDDEKRGTARLLDLKREGAFFQRSNPRATERSAGALFVYSIGQRPQGRRGATEREIKAASFVPDPTYGIGDADGVLAELQSPETGLAALERLEGRGGQEARLVLSTRQTLNMFFRAQRNSVSDSERDAEVAAAAERLIKTGPFRDKVFVEAPSEDSDRISQRSVLEAAAIDNARLTRLVVLDPRRFTLLNGVDRETREAIRAALGIGPEKLTVGWASSAVFAVANTQRRSLARNHATTYLAWARVADIEAVRVDDDLRAKAKEELGEARKRLERSVREAFQHVVFLAEDSSGSRVDRMIRFDKEGQSSLDGSIVWTALTEEDKAFAVGEFDAKALMHNLRPEDFGRPLSEIRDSFWNTPRLPLLPGGEEDLRRAIFSAVREGSVRLVDKDGVERAASTWGEVNVASAGLRLMKPAEEVIVPDLVGKSLAEAEAALGALGLSVSGSGSGVVTEQAVPPGTTLPKGISVLVDFSGAPTRDAPDQGSPAVEEAAYSQVSITLNASLSDEARRGAVRKLLSSLHDAADQSASHVQATIKITVDAADRKELVEKATEAGAHINVTEL